MKKTKNIGVLINAPKEECVKDTHCPFHGQQNVRGRCFVGKVIKSKIPKCVTVEWTGQAYDKKYERYYKTRTKVKAHNPVCISAKEGDIVKIMETRKISKTKCFVVIEKLGV
ncbi:MAG: 30S ribosomal protein S17 [Candidatus Woesearchaeota archaeon]